MRKLKLALKYILAIFFVVAGVNHFVSPDVYQKIIPPYRPWHSLLVYLSGFLEVVLGVLLLIPKFAHLAAWSLIALLMAVFPANIHMAIHHKLFPEYSTTALWLRLPLQFVMRAWAYWYTRSNRPARLG